jgi:2-aminoadipate transaminase
MKKNSSLSALGQRSEAPPISWLMEIALARPKLVSLAAGFTDNESLPVNEVREVLHEMLSAPKIGQAALQYGTTAGDPELRQITANQLLSADEQASGAGKLRPAREIYSPKRLLITNGSQQLLYMATEALCDEGDVILVEDPTYFVYLGIAQSRALKCRGLRLEKDGIDLAHLEEVLASLKRSGEIKRLKMLYLVSYFQNPSAVTTSFAKKKAALELLQRYEKFAGHPIYLLEDAAYRGLRFAGADVPSALAAGKFAERVIYAGTYSKPFATGARVGFGILPEPLLTVVTRIKGNHDFGSSNLLQQLLKRAITSGAYDRHLADLQMRYGCKAKAMLTALDEYFPRTVKWEPPLGGLYVWARLPEKIATGATSKLFKTALENDVLYVPGQLCYCDDSARRKPNHEMRLSFGGATVENIGRGVERLGRVIPSL